MKKKSNQSGFGVIEGLILLVVLGLIGCTGWHILHSKNDSRRVTSVNQPQIAHKAKTQPTISNDAIQTDNFKTYTNTASGFSIQVPKNVLYGYGSPCTTSDFVYDNYGKKVPSEVSYRPAEGVVPVTVIANGTNFTVTEEYTYQLTDSHDDGSGHGIFKGCKKTLTTPDVVTESEKPGGSPLLLDSVPIKVFPASNNSEITAKARTIFGDRIIGVGSLKPNATNEWMDVGLTCSDECLDLFNGKFYLRYYGQQQKLVFMELGQSGHLQHPKADGFYGQTVVDSFKLIK